MFENNILTFNPGQDTNINKLKSFADAREIQKNLKEKGVKLEYDTDKNTKDPASFVVIDPDGNTILVDQFA